MADKLFNKNTGVQAWNVAANWTPSGVPASGDRAYIKSGDSTLVISAGSTQAAVNLAELVVYDTFVGSLTVDVGYALARIGFPSGSTTGNGGSGRIVLTPGSTSGTTLVYKTGSGLDATSGLGAFRWSGTGTANVLSVFGGSVDVATDLTAAAVNELDVMGGSVTVGPNATTYAVNVTGGTLSHSGLSAAGGDIVQTGGSVVTNGATLFDTITVTGATAYLNHRAASGASANTVTIGNGGVVSLTGDPRTFTTTNKVKLSKGGAVILSSDAQIPTGIATDPAARISAA